jgi:hypothetical protein
MNDTVQVYDQLVIIPNFSILQKKDTDTEAKRWVDEIKKIQSMYNMDTRYPFNKTIILGYSTKTTFVIPLDIYTNHTTIVVPKTCNNFVDTYLISIINYLTATIKVSCSWDIANEIKFKCNVYLPTTHGDHDKLKTSPYIRCYPGNHKKTSLGRILNEDHVRYEFIFYFKEDFSIIPYSQMNTMQINYPCSMNID